MIRSAWPGWRAFLTEFAGFALVMGALLIVIVVAWGAMA